MMYGPKESDTGIVAEKPANKAVRAVAELAEPRPVTNGNSFGQSTDRTQSRGSVNQAAERIRRSQLGPRSLPEVGAVCVNAHVRICAGGAGQPASLPRNGLPVTFAHPGDPHESLTARRAYASVPRVGFDGTVMNCHDDSQRSNRLAVTVGHLRVVDRVVASIASLPRLGWGSTDR